MWSSIGKETLEQLVNYPCLYNYTPRLNILGNNCYNNLTFYFFIYLGFFFFYYHFCIFPEGLKCCLTLDQQGAADHLASWRFHNVHCHEDQAQKVKYVK